MCDLHRILAISIWHGVLSAQVILCIQSSSPLSMKYASTIIGLSLLAAVFVAPTQTLASSRLYRQPIRVNGNIFTPSTTLFERSSGEYSRPLRGGYRRGLARTRGDARRPSARSINRQSLNRDYARRTARDAQIERLGVRQRTSHVRARAQARLRARGLAE